MIDKTDSGFGASEGTDETSLRWAIAELERQRVTTREGYFSASYGLGFVLLRIGRARYFWLLIAVLVLAVVVTLVARSLQIALVGLLAVALVSWYEWFHVEEWVAEHNARVDDQIRQLLAEGRRQDD